jgi:starvation-inducible DNA-binding protein
MSEIFITRISIPQDNIDAVVNLLNTQLANSAAAQMMIKFGHWNVKGEGFWATHKLFDEIYECTVDATDDIGERIGSLGGVAEGLPEQVTGHCKLSDYSANRGNEPVRGHLEAMADLIGQLANEYRAAADICSQTGDRISEDLMTKLAGDMDHKLYFIEAHLRA